MPRPLGFLAIPLAALIGAARLVAAPTMIYVAPTGEHGAAGTVGEPMNFEDARDKVRGLAGKKSVEVVLAAGVYELPSPAVFGPADSGTGEMPVVWRAADDAKVVLSAGRTLKLDWRPRGDGVFTARVPDDVKAFDQLFVDGVRRVLARYPNFDANAQYLDGVAEDSTASERVKGWKHPEGGFVHALHNGLWGGFHYEITGASPDGKLQLKGGTQNNRPEHGPSKSKRFVENIAEELDAPGEWFFDAATHTLSFYPPAGVDIAVAKVSVPQSESVVRFQGEPGKPVHDIAIRGVTFTQTLRTFMKTAEPLLRSDWRIYRGGAAYFNNAENCSIADSDFDSVGGNAVFVDAYNSRIAITGTIIREAGASGVAFVGSADAVRGPVFVYGEKRDLASVDLTPGPKSEAYPRDCLVRNCLILHTGRVEKQSAGVTIDMAARVRVESCTIARVPRSGINIGEGAFGGHVIEDNDVFDTVLETSDHGAFNSWGRDRFWNANPGVTVKWIAEHPEMKFLDVVEPNIIRHNRFRCDHGWDIDLDDGSSNYVIVNNLLLHGGLKFREGYNRTAKNNIMVGNTFHPHVWYPASGDTFENNIVFRPYAPIGMTKVWAGKVDGNFLQVAGGASGPAAVLAKQSGGDATSRTGDALFVNPALGDYSVKPGSPALAVGFVSFPTYNFGVYTKRLLALAPQPPLPKAGAEEKESARDPRSVMILGGTVKNLAGLGEVSATGMIEETGVLVLELPETAVLAKLGVRPRDVILTWNGKPVADAAALDKAVKTSGTPKSIGIWRNQRGETLKP